jgi:hypothetical protein
MDHQRLLQMSKNSAGKNGKFGRELEHRNWFGGFGSGHTVVRAAEFNDRSRFSQSSETL